MKTLLTILCCLSLAATAFAGGGGGAAFAGAVDNAPPTLVSATIPSAGDSITLVFNRAVTDNNNGASYVSSLSMSAFITTFAVIGGYTSGNGTTTVALTISSGPIVLSEPVTLDITPGLTSVTGVAVAVFAGYSVTNNSEQ